MPESVAERDMGAIKLTETSQRLQGKTFARTRWPKEDSQPRWHREVDVQREAGEVPHGSNGEHLCRPRWRDGMRWIHSIRFFLFQNIFCSTMYHSTCLPIRC